MRTDDKNANAELERTRIIGDIRKLFASYGPTFVQLADGERSDMSALLNFYGAPLRFIGPNFHMVMKDEEDITVKRESVVRSAGCGMPTLQDQHWTSVTSECSILRPRWSMHCGCAGTKQAI